ncbi:hypothetical protein SAMN05421678_10410 [Actinopolymorpha cephalotaxi]|uniref:Uncharacterized protein n=1 Tax=Actinopolymorpha cephalotaxi TaxID=504797 RepID=A0A1I2PC97_9ACTN|nr:hypothetical protein [Actinopolymorpha cephalotaxi]SFG11567.1 hypothetical protein SAMN05421678_10410 [Actinopolymorpha cephalotaxi]
MADWWWPVMRRLRMVVAAAAAIGRRDLYVMRANGTGVTRIPGTVSAGSPDWGVR